DPKDKVNVDQFVVVTFTKAAAAQMKDRLRQRIDQALEKDPENTHLQKQAALVAKAHISTVHSFCNFVIKNYFHRIGMDPAYRQGDDIEMKMLSQETLEELLEREYQEAREDFMELASWNCFNKSDRELEEMILSLYNQALSQPFPKEWLDMAESYWDLQGEGDWDRHPAVQFVVEASHKVGQGLVEEAKRLEKICLEPAGPHMFLPATEEMAGLGQKLKDKKSYRELYDLLNNFSWDRLSAKKDPGVDPDLRQQVKDDRDKVKKIINKWTEDYFFQSPEDHLEDVGQMKKAILCLTRLTRQYLEDFTNKKRDRGVIDYNDMEQLTLEILLTKDQEGNWVRTEAARELALFFQEIMIDEYQDSNRVQDTILTSISRIGMEGYAPNLFMVGDVKQSIYRFRNACPELFGEKLYSYRGPEAQGVRIDLHENFRSRSQVLSATNDVFEQVMHLDLGGVEYDKDARLVPGMKYPETELRTGGLVRVIYGQPKSNRKKDLEEGELEAFEAGEEAAILVDYIRELMNPKDPLYVRDGEDYRPLRYSDIAVLMRSTKNMGQKVYDALADGGIPSVMERDQGFFDTREIQIMSQMLQVIDNPRVDLPLAGVLLSPMFSFGEEDLVKIRQKDRKCDLYTSLKSYEGEGELGRKIQDFFALLDKLRSKVSYARVADLIQDVYEATDIYNKLAMMRDGAQRQANMDYLMELARAYDATVYHGIHQFVHYIEKIRRLQQEMGEMNISGEEEDVVRIMTIHKSKGLEYPVCIVMGMGRDLKLSSKGMLVTDSELGLGIKKMDSKKSLVKKNFFKNAIDLKYHFEGLGEEMRILYVAMTRAKEQLCLIGLVDDKEGGDVNFMTRYNMKCFADMVQPALEKHPMDFERVAALKEEILKE
ncbi:MAG: helicase-exonuclease AddAB subunit AddA, partial [Eubacterium sp.]|nr:helicase-exonuclease AddAB subunit AddA [Eubacterium sp.]